MKAKQHIPINLTMAIVIAAVFYLVIYKLPSVLAQQSAPSNLVEVPAPSAEINSTIDVTPTGIGSTAPTSTPTIILSPTPETTPPSVQITNPLNNSRVTRNSTLTITANASDSSGINRVEFYVNSSLVCTDTTAPYSCPWFVPKKPNAQYQIQVTGFDAFQNAGAHNITVTSR